MFPSEEVIVGVKCPTLIVHGVMDQVMEGTSVRKGQMKRGAKARTLALSLSLSRASSLFLDSFSFLSPSGDSI
jgi:hypothetical protein